ncbi:GPALPP motifs-containing protein 1-like [Conger conger]|uniref:GPALPP motifs-containing protein 1-like n=1 Tax=Conger conger TaxID=82655 RepID=UPI002A59981C|nr:GPALPP motifs-containing protein 1-like [Conger conger]
MSDDIIGPALPPSFRKSSNDDSDEEDTLVGPALPPGYSARDLSSSSEDSDKEEVVFKRGRPSAGREESRDGPTAKKLRTVEEKDNRDYAVEDDDGFFGPALPPGYEKKQSSPERCPVLGPALPPGFRRPAEDEDDDDDRDSEGFPGPALPPGYRAEASSSDDDIIGPLPSKGGVQNTVAMDFERRAQKMKKKLISGDDGPVEMARETWMTELPPELQHIGLGARTFKKRSGPENKDRSIWTDTPADRQRKAQERLEGKQGGEEEEKKKKKKEEELPRISQKDLQMAEKVSKYNDMKRSESLISMHSKKMKKRAEEKAEEKPAERRPFDRDNDLQVNRFDEAQKKSLLKKSQELNTRFSHSKERMFL